MHMYIHIMLLGVHMHRINFACKAQIQNKLHMQGTYTGVVKGGGGQSLMHNDAWMKSGKICFLKTLVRCCHLHLEAQRHLENSLSSFHWTLCLCFLVLQVVDCALLAPLLRVSVFLLYSACLALYLCVAGAGMQWLHLADLGMNQWGC